MICIPAVFESESGLYVMVTVETAPTSVGFIRQPGEQLRQYLNYLIHI